MTGTRASSLLGAAALAIVLIAVALLVSLVLGTAAERIMTVFLINLIAVLGIGVFSGNSGILSFGHVAFMGVGAYASALLTLPSVLKQATLPDLPVWLAALQLDLWPALGLTMVFVGVIALIIGLPISRLSGSAAAIATLGLLVIVHSVLIGAKDFTRGSQSFFGVPRATTLGVALALAVVALVVARLFRDSVPGLQLRAAREDELAARAIGVDVNRRQLAAWVVSALLVGASGVLLGHFLGTFSPKKFYFIDTFQLLAMLILGGMTTVTGAFGGTVVVTAASEVLRRFESGGEILGITYPAVFGTTQIGLSLLILVVMARTRAGLFGLLEWDEALRRRGPSSLDTCPPDLPRVAPAGRLAAHQASKHFDGLIALDRVDLALAPGEIVGLIGPNGSGKTTLLNLISGALAASGGQVLLDDKDITRLPAHRRARHGIGRTFQNIRLFAHLSTLENVEAAAVTVAPRRAARRLAEALLAAMGLSEVAQRPVGTLAYGAQRRVEIARALALKPHFLLLDEPAAGMNPAESRALLADLARLREDYGIGLLVVDHDLDLIMRLCDRVVVLNKGQVIAAGAPEAVQRDPAVIEAYLGRRRRVMEQEEATT